MSSKQKGLYGKFLVIKVVDGTVIDDCFILRPQKDPAAVKALQTYAAHTENRALAEDLYKWVGKPDTMTQMLKRANREQKALHADFKSYLTRIIKRDGGVYACALCKHYRNSFCPEGCGGYNHWEWRGIPDQKEGANREA